MKIKRAVECQMCHTLVDLWVEPEDITAYTLGGMVQDVFPYLTPAERELIISGTCGPCFDYLFGESE